MTNTGSHQSSDFALMIKFFLALIGIVCFLGVSGWVLLNWFDDCGAYKGQCHAVTWVDVPQ